MTINSDLILALKLIETREENQRLTRERIILKMQFKKLMQLKTTLQETNKKLKRDIQEINEKLNK
jgi:hypothetical protein